MAYKNLVNIDCIDKAEFFCRVRDFICARNGTYDYSTTGIGWTLIDSSYVVDENNPAAGDWFVIYSPGEGGRDDLYFKHEWITLGIRTVGYLYWDISTHTGTIEYGHSHENYALSVAETGADYVLLIYGDLDQVAVIHSTGLYNYSKGFGKLENGVAGGLEEIAISTDNPVSGTDIVITVDVVPSTWFVGQPIVIRDNSNVEIITIKAISGNGVTVDLTNPYSSPKLSDFIGYFSGRVGFPGIVEIIISWSGYINAYEDLSLVNNVTNDLDPGPSGYPFHAMGDVHAASSVYGYFGKMRNGMAVSYNTTLSVGDVVVDVMSGSRYRFASNQGSKSFMALEV